MLSVNLPVAANCSDSPLAMPGSTGLTEMETSAALVTVSVEEPEMLVPGYVAVMFVVPPSTEVAKPREPSALLIVATPVPDEFHVTFSVISWVVLSVNVPLALNSFASPLAMIGFSGSTEMDAIVAFVTLNVVDPETGVVPA